MTSIYWMLQPPASANPLVDVSGKGAECARKVRQRRDTLEQPFDGEKVGVLVVPVVLVEWVVDLFLMLGHVVSFSDMK